MKLASLKGKSLHIYAIVGFILLIMLSALWLMRFARSFPFVDPGMYLGSIEFSKPSASDSLMFYAERGEGQGELLFVVVERGWEPQRIQFLSGSSSLSTKTLPVSVAGPDVKLRLVGAEVETEKYSGAAYDIDGELVGRWSMRKLYKDPVSGTGDSSLLSLLKIKGELYLIEQQKNLEHERLAQVNEELQRLGSLVTDRDGLHLSVEDRLLAKSQELKEVNQELAAELSQLAALQRQIELAQGVTAMGKLVSLSRETLDREARYVESMFRAAPVEISSDHRGEQSEADRIFQLRRDIQEERRRIEELGGRVQ